ncbi:hypothetical protein B0H16DRAFT_1734241 [Mycena metata]|uniref:Uncharacterized protein n=1 Tax=Mycena metata TaxID=1033252 RepID=A0AAD7MSZ4_9AGAR|nr:hypothetical protein B0H16DRAFT_1734241 [Mycena metata]
MASSSTTSRPSRSASSTSSPTGSIPPFTVYSQTGSTATDPGVTALPGNNGTSSGDAGTGSGNNSSGGGGGGNGIQSSAQLEGG